MPYEFKMLLIMQKKTNQLKGNTMIQVKTTYQSKNWDKRIAKYCEENKKAKAIRNSLTKKQREQVKKDLEDAVNFVKQTFKNMESK